MMNPPGLFITGTDTGVGKTYLTALIARQLASQGHRVGVYKPAGSGCDEENTTDSQYLWHAAGCPLRLEDVCPQEFSAPLAPHLAARAEQREVDATLLRTGLEPWKDSSDIVLVEGVGGLMSPLSDDDYVADLIFEFGYPLIVVTADRIGTINQTLQTLITAATFRGGLPLAGVVLNQVEQSEDVSRDTNWRELEQRCVPPVIAHLRHGSLEAELEVDWSALAGHAKH
ncbi:MAG TPA: dethiobiotin synthase [Planctomycetaceae bacterium]|nr:dethiobiotin synthase [Planctomycetaceae bacterium]|tara:strand:+ start:4150 stop:4833 length:684 start_codon:yes stop_codon:yes gene_type:complete